MATNGRPRPVPFTIGAGASLSGAVATGGEPVVAIVTPSGWDTAAISLQASHDGGTTYNVVWEGSADAEYGVAAVVASRYVAIDPALTAGATHVKVQSGTSAATTNQADAVTGSVVTRVVG
jgi:hypothetical protein